jgi:hypothetical protein
MLGSLLTLSDLKTSKLATLSPGARRVRVNIQRIRTSLAITCYDVSAQPLECFHIAVDPQQCPK